MERTIGRTVFIVPPVEGLHYRGRLVAYARAREGQRFAVLDTGREIVAFRSDSPELEPGRDVHATAHEIDDHGHRRLVWRLGDNERRQQRERG